MLGDKIIFACAVLIYMSHYLEKAKEKLSLRISPNADVLLLWSCCQMNLVMVLLWIRVGFECSDSIRIPYMEKLVCD